MMKPNYNANGRDQVLYSKRDMLSVIEWCGSEQGFNLIEEGETTESLFEKYKLSQPEPIEDKQRPNIKDFFENNVPIGKVHESYQLAPELYNYIGALDRYIDYLEDKQEQKEVYDKNN